MIKKIITQRGKKKELLLRNRIGIQRAHAFTPWCHPSWICLIEGERHANALTIGDERLTLRTGKCGEVIVDKEGDSRVESRGRDHMMVAW